jgi:hypothetical protein
MWDVVFSATLDTLATTPAGGELFHKVPKALNGEDHYAYASGYGDGTVRPQESVTRAEAAVMLYRLLTEERREELADAEETFSDVTADQWYAEAVDVLAAGGYLSGYPDGTFRGDETLTRAEFAVILARFMAAVDLPSSFPDVETGSWDCSAISTIAAMGWMNGYEDGTFCPDKAITRGEVMCVLNRVVDRGVNVTSDLLDYQQWSDTTDMDAWYYYEIVEATTSHTYMGIRPSEQWVTIETDP